MGARATRQPTAFFGEHGANSAISHNASAGAAFTVGLGFARLRRLHSKTPVHLRPRFRWDVLQWLHATGLVFDRKTQVSRGTCHDLCRCSVQIRSVWYQSVFLTVGEMISDVTCTLPFTHLNLRRNPFGEFSVEEWTALADVDVEEFDAFLGEPGSAVQFLGEKGYGKTTHLLAIRSRFGGAAYVHIAEGERAEIPKGNPQLIDEAQRLTWRQQRRLFRSTVPLVLGTHRDFGRALVRAGRTVRTVAVDDRMSPARLTRILNSRIEWVRRDEGPVPGVRLETAASLIERFGPDVRRIQFDLYKTFQTMQDGIRDV